MDKCYQGTNVPEPIQEPCGNTYISTNCVSTPASLIYLDLPAGSSQTQVNNNIILGLKSVNDRIDEIGFAETSTTSTPISLTTLNSTYPSALVGFRLQCPNIGLIYEKTNTGWLSISATIVT